MRCRLLLIIALFFFLPAQAIEIIVKYESSLAKPAPVHARKTIELTRPPAPRFVMYDIDSDHLESALQQLRRASQVEYVQLNQTYRLTTIPNDPFYPSQTHLPQIKAPDAWEITTGSKDVIIAIIDTGIDLEHPDLAANIWSNPNEIDDGIDNDGNGYVDDVHGWDFVDAPNEGAPGEDDDTPDNLPMDFLGHGTQVAGCAAAVSNNSIGISGTAWRASLMPLRAGFKGRDGNGYVTTAAVIQAMQYAIIMSADVINLSFELESDQPVFTDLAAWAMYQNTLVVWAAGNSNSSRGFAPLTLPHVLSVAAVNPYDVKSGFSNYGDWVDISAPGGAPGVFTTTLDADYAYASGTSFAAPIVAGAAALVRSAQPDWHAADILLHLTETAKPIDAQNPRYSGLLGAGRLDLHTALTSLFSARPRFSLQSVKIDDAGGNNDRTLDSGETVRLIVGVENSRADAPRVSAELRCPDPSIELESAFADFGDIAGLSEYGRNYADNSHAPFRLTVKPTFPHTIPFQLLLTSANGFQDTLAVPLSVGAQMLLVDDDDQIHDTESIYKTLLDSIGMPFDIWNRAERGAPHSLQNYNMVIWSCANALPSLEAADRSVLETFLDNGGKLLLAGQDIGWDLCAPQSAAEQAENPNQFTVSNGASKSFFEAVFKTRFVKSTSAYRFAGGVTGDPIGDGLDFSIYNPFLSTEDQSPDCLEPLPAQPLLTYPDGEAAAVRDEQLVYLGFGGLEAVAHEEDRLEILRRILTFFTGIELQPWDVQPKNSLRFLAICHSDDPVTVSVFWQPDNQDFNRTEMVRLDSLYWLSLPTYIFKRRLRYGYFAENDAGYYAPFKMKTLLRDTPPPSITVIEDQFVLGQPIPRCRVAAEHGLSYVMLHYWRHETAPAFLIMQPSGDQYIATLPQSYPPGDTLFYRITATDSLGVATRSPDYFTVTGREDFSMTAGWQADSNWTFIEDGVEYRGNSHAGLTADTPINLANATTARLLLKTDYDFANKSKGWIDVHFAGQWRPLEALFGQSDISSRYFDLSAACGDDSVFIRLRVQADSSAAKSRWKIEDIRVETEVSVSVNTATPSPETLALRFAPNPFNHAVRIEFDAPPAADAEILIYDVRGRLVRKLDANAKRTVIWNGRNVWGLPVPSGLYFCRLTTSDKSLVKKVTLLR